MLRYLILLIAATPLPASAQTPAAMLVGTVLDETGSPLLEANVSIVGLDIGTVTDENGRYELRVRQGLIGESVQVKASFVGYRTVTRTRTITHGENRHDFSLSIDVLRIDEVVVTAMGVGMSKDKLGVTIDKVDPEVVVNSDEANVVAALSGKVPNVEVASSSGDPGAGAYIRIRGVNSINGGTQPLFVVDGSPVNNQSLQDIGKRMDVSIGGVTQQNRASDINPEDIESIEILKGAAAAAMYGSRAANGVVLITTKQGRPGRPRISYKISYSMDKVNESVPLQRSYGQGSDGEFVDGIPLSWGPRVTGVPTYDHAWEVFETGHRFEHNLTVSGGSDRTTYYLSVGRTDHDGAIVGKADYLRDAFRVKASQIVTDKLKLTGNASLALVTSNRLQKGSNVSGLLIGAFRTPPDFNNQPYLDPVTGFHRTYRVPNPTSEAGARGYDNPFFVVNEHTNISEVDRMFGNVALDYDPLPWVNVNYTLGHDFASDHRKTVLPIGSSSFPDGRVIRDEYVTRETDGNLIVTATRRFNAAQANVDVVVGHNMNQTEISQFSVQGDNISVSGFDQLGGVASSSPQELESTVRIEGYFAQALVELWNQLYLTAGVRNDGSSVFAEGKRRHWYPKFSSAWEFTESRVVRSLRWLDFGKVRLAYGETGRVPAAYSTITAFKPDIVESDWGETLSTNSLGFGGLLTDPIKGQPDIGPERAKEMEMGLDLGLYRNRIGLGLTYYRQKTTDVIYSLPVPPSTGFKAQFQNLGTIQNNGLELALDFVPVSRKNLKWSVTALYARNRNKVTSLPSADFITLGPFEELTTGGSVIEGQPFGVTRGADYVRFGNGSTVNGVSIDEAFSGWDSGDLYIEEDGYPIIDPEFRVIGDPNPDWTGSIRSSVSLHRNLKFSVLFDIKNGGTLWNGTKGALVFFGTHATTEDREGTQVFDGIGPGQGKAVSKGQEWYAVKAGSLFTGIQSTFTEDGGYVKLREISGSYTFRNDAVKRLGLRDIEIRLSARNLKTWTDYTGIDPETNVTGVSSLRGIDFFSHPQTRSYVLTARFNY